MKSFGCIAYEAYCGHTGWKSLISGAQLPPWSDLKPEIRAAWDVAAGAIAVAAETGEFMAGVQGFMGGATAYAREAGHSTLLSQNPTLKAVCASAPNAMDRERECAEPQTRTGAE